MNFDKCFNLKAKFLLDLFQVTSMQANPDKFQAIAVGKRTYGKKKL